MAASISVQVLNYNGKRFLKDCLDSLLKQDYPNFELVLIDNASTDGSMEFVEQKYKNEIKEKKLRIIRFKRNYGLTGAYNRSYKNAKTDYVLLLNNDIIVPKKNLISLLMKTAQKEGAEIVGGVDWPIGKKIEMKKIEKSCTINVLGFDTPNIIKKKEVFYVGGGCCLIDKSKVNFLFLEEYFVYGEDVYFSWRAKIRGYKVIFDKNAIYLHYGSGTNTPRSYFVRVNAERNRLTNLLIFFEAKTLLKIFPLFVFELLVKSIYSIKHYPKLFSAPFSAIWWNISHLGFLIKNRRLIQKERKVKDKDLIKLMSYKIFPEHISTKLAKRLNSLVRNYCKTIGLRTYDIN